MKLRIRGNSVRLRVTRTELERIAAGEAVTETTDFGGGQRLKYRLVSDHDATGIGAAFEAGVVTVTLPAPVADEWASTDSVSLGADQSAGAGESLSILVEKDFQCLAPREGEDESDMFPHPEAAGGAC